MRLGGTAVAALALLLMPAGCGNGAGDALDETAEKLGEIRSGRISMTLKVTPSTADSQVGFELNGPFSLPDRGGELPEAALRYTQIAGTRRGDVQFISSRKEAWVEVEGQAYELPPDQVEGLAAGGAGGASPLADLDVASWTKDAELEDGEPVAGEQTERIRAEVDVVRALNDALSVAGRLGGDGQVAGLQPLQGTDAEQLESAVSSSSLEVLTGKEDRLLRRLTLNLDVGLSAPRELAGGLGLLRGARVRLDLRIENPNAPVDVEAPDGALPYSELPSG